MQGIGQNQDDTYVSSSSPGGGTGCEVFYLPTGWLLQGVWNGGSWTSGSQLVGHAVWFNDDWWVEQPSLSTHLSACRTADNHITSRQVDKAGGAGCSVCTHWDNCYEMSCQCTDAWRCALHLHISRRPITCYNCPLTILPLHRGRTLRHKFHFARVCLPPRRLPTHPAPVMSQWGGGLSLETVFNSQWSSGR